jgi:hypothetical protein
MSDFFQDIDRIADAQMDFLKGAIETIASDPLIALRFISGISLLAEGAYDNETDRASAIDELLEGIIEEMVDKEADEFNAAVANADHARVVS